MKKFATFFLVLVLIILIVLTVVSNYKEQLAVDQSKISWEVEDSKGFQKWITNLKNKGFEIEADEFRLIEENEIYNSKWITVYSIDNSDTKEFFEKTINSHQELPDVEFSPSERQFIDYRNIQRSGLEANEARYFGLRDDKLIDARILDCSVRANCYFDRAYFINNESFVISEISRNFDKKRTDAADCSSDEVCTYTFKLHVIDLIKNSRLIYESNPIELVLDEAIPNL